MMIVLCVSKAILILVKVKDKASFDTIFTPQIKVKQNTSVSVYR